MARKIGYLPLALGSLFGAAAAVGYVRYLRPRMLTWGTLTEEVFLELPGDDLLPAPRLEATHAINIYTPAYRVWPWLVQMGQGRGGFYTYDWLENLLGLDMHSANRVLAMYQDLRPGDTLPLAPNGFGPKVAVLEENRALVLHADTRQGVGEIEIPLRPGDFLAVTWGFYLYEIGDGVTRLVERWKADWNPTLLNNLFYRVLLEPGAFIMERGMLEGIRDRAEGKVVWQTAGSDSPRTAAAGIELGAHIADRRQPADQYAGNRGGFGVERPLAGNPNVDDVNPAAGVANQAEQPGLSEAGVRDISPEASAEASDLADQIPGRTDRVPGVGDQQSMDTRAADEE
jgi:hypothetical protein